MGSRKGERRGNARIGRRIPHETPGEVLDDHARRPRRAKTTERRLEVARVIHGDSGHAIDMSMKEILSYGARYHMQAVKDWERFVLQHASIIPPTKASTAAVIHGEAMIEKHLMLSKEHARDAAPYFAPKLAAAVVKHDTGDTESSIISDLMNDIDERMREKSGMLIEHDPIKKVVG